jgi:hypothetical protein
MFVRFRKLPNGGFQPPAAAKDAALPAWRLKGHRRRWLIAGQEPYRLKVILVENTRTNGRVKQDIVAILGTIDATWLASFWTDPELKTKHWELYSLRARVAFWGGVIARMSKIGDNRLSQEDRVAIRRQIHKVIPWVMKPEKKRLAILEAQKEYEQFRDLHDWAERDVTRDRETIAHATKKLKEQNEQSASTRNQS